MNCSMPGFPVLHYLPEFAQTHVHWVGDAIQLSHPILLLPSMFPSMRVISNEPALCIRWPKYWSFSFSTSPSNEYSGSISFRIDWFDLLAVWGTRKSLIQHHCLKTSILWLCTEEPGGLQSIGSQRVGHSWSDLAQMHRLLYSPTFTSIHDYWKNYSFDYMDFYWQSDVSAL